MALGYLSQSIIYSYFCHGLVLSKLKLKNYFLGHAVWSYNSYLTLRNSNWLLEQWNFGHKVKGYTEIFWVI